VIAISGSWLYNHLIMSRFLAFLARPVLFFYALPWLMLLLVLGTLAQRYDGLYQAERVYFSSPIFWLGVLPLPGTVTILAVIVLNLLAKLVQQKGWTGKKLGVAITHVSILLLLVGGGVTALLREEGFIELTPAATSQQVTDYHQRELVVTKNGVPLQTLPFENLAAGQGIAGLPFGLRVTAACRHCTPAAVTNPTADLRGAAQKFSLQAEKPLAQDEDNVSGVTLEVSGLDATQNGVYVAFTPMLMMPEVTQGQDRYQFIIRRAVRDLPFSIRLEQFHKSEHPGTRIARDYRSDVMVTDGSASWPVTIAMNEPLRYRGYTLYQSSFVERPDATATVLTVVRDRGQIFPYLAITAMCLGMVIHLITRLPPRRPRHKAGEV